VREELLAADNAEFLGMFAAGRRYAGTFHSDQKTDGAAGLLFISCDAAGKEVRAELFDPKTPGPIRPFGGALLDDPKTQRKMLVLAALGSTLNSRPRPDGQVVGSNIFDPQVQLIIVRFDPMSLEKKFLWKAAKTSPEQPIPDFPPITLLLQPTASNAAQLSDAERRVKENPHWTIPVHILTQSLRGQPASDPPATSSSKPGKPTSKTPKSKL
jgi:hypothetical protein